MAILSIAGAAALLLSMQAHGAQPDFETDVQAATAPCIEANRTAIESNSVTDAQWKEIITCVFTNTAAQMDSQLPKKVDQMTTLVSVSSNGPTFNYTYVLDVAMDSVRQENIDSLEAATQQNTCSTDSMVNTISLGGSYFYRWVDRSGTQITSMLIDGC